MSNKGAKCKKLFSLLYHEHLLIRNGFDAMKSLFTSHKKRTIVWLKLHSHLQHMAYGQHMRQSSSELLRSQPCMNTWIFSCACMKCLSIINTYKCTKTLMYVHICQCICPQKGLYWVYLCGTEQSDKQDELYSHLHYWFLMLVFVFQIAYILK